MIVIHITGSCRDVFRLTFCIILVTVVPISPIVVIITVCTSTAPELLSMVRGTVMVQFPLVTEWELALAVGVAWQALLEHLSTILPVASDVVVILTSSSAAPEL
ncbi:unnamed protein product [Meganyctiphanes norvegica]|uniref:Uncharacterized protein n=1 Tax=Meganyctiphanes norvegica TaxID=48144 RepID=A0AAV2R0E1_MEGNR